jgi:hypothetical protein
MPDGGNEDRRSSPRPTSKDPQLIKNSLRGLHGKSQLFPADISTMQQALMDISDNLSEILKRLENLEATASDGGSGRHAVGTAGPTAGPTLESRGETGTP